VLLKGNQRATERRKIAESIASGEAQIIIGTHALIQNEIEYQRLGLVVVDEQHRFGVTQRSALFKKGTNPDMLVMTATPIPRSLALTMYGDLDVSILDELPPGRQPIRTARRKSERRNAIFDFLVDQIRQGRQAYIVYPLVEESEELGFKSAVEAYQELKTGVLSDFQLGLLHGRLASEEKASIMEDFKANRLQCLVCTTVIEVGLDVPNATVMIIEHAGRFGLAQLHQLRGRVGRGSKESYCILISDEVQENNVSKGEDRLDALVANQDGFALADRDLELRGPGEFFGTRQAGMPEFKMADIILDVDLLEIARREVEFSFLAEKTK
jgi:ATP-dependent DNA helicase RecG